VNVSTLNWREPALFSAHHLLGFEPCIHWSEMQMQPGIIGITTRPIYSPATALTLCRVKGMSL
jgi:deoxyribodipyrimidine photo-lyase